MKLDQAFRLIEEREDALVGTLRDIIRFDNSVPPGRNYDALVDYLQPRFAGVGMDTQRVVVPEEKLAAIPFDLEGPRVNLVSTWRTGLEPVTVYAHMDTVPVEEEWKHDPFGGELEDGKLYGRGVTDMKGSIVAKKVTAGIAVSVDFYSVEHVYQGEFTIQETGASY